MYSLRSPPVHDGPMKVVNEFSESSETEDALLRAVRQAWIVAESTEEEESTKKDAFCDVKLHRPTLTFQEMASKQLAPPSRNTGCPEQ